MQIVKVLNNNVVISEQDGNECILMGRGLAFGKKSGDSIAAETVEKTYVLSSDAKQLLQEIPVEIVEMADKIISFAKQELTKTLTDKAFITMADHLHGVQIRVAEGVYLKNFLMWDIKRFFADEFRVGQFAKQLLSDYLGKELPDDEAGFIALNLVNAELGSSDASAQDLTLLIEEILTIVKYSLELPLDMDNIYVERFMTHLKFFCERVLTHKRQEDLLDAEMLGLLKDKYPLAYDTSRKIADYLQTTRGYAMSEDEQMYLLIHLSRIKK